MDLVKMVDAITSVASAGTTEIILKIVLLVLGGIGSILLWKKKAKEAEKQTQRRRDSAMSEIPEENSKITKDAQKAERDIDDLLGD